MRLLELFAESARKSNNKWRFNMLTCHLTAFIIGYLMDLILGDPENLYHPVRLIGNLIARLEKKQNVNNLDGNIRRKRGRLLVVIVLITTAAYVGLILIVAYALSYKFGILVEAFMTYLCLAIKSLKDESRKVQRELEAGDISGARMAVSMIVGRDTAGLDEAGITRAAVETVAENTSDGVIAPMICLAIGGPVLGWIYKAINTMDSMVGYHNDRYEDYGRAAARLDDVANFIPARVSAVFMIMASYILQIFMGTYYSGSRAFKIFKRDRFNHKSPNSAQTESVCAGALGIRLAGDAYYFGKLVEKPYIGDDIRPIEPADIHRSHVLLYLTSFICFIICLAAILLILMRIN